MAYIICEPCIGTKDSACVDVCPVDCIHPRKDEPAFEAAEMLYIHPDECIDCGACVPACPVEAIFALDETPEKWKSFIPVNAEYYQKKRLATRGSRLVARGSWSAIRDLRLAISDSRDHYSWPRSATRDQRYSQQVVRGIKSGAIGGVGLVP